MSESKAIDHLLSEASVPIRWRVEREILGRKKPETVLKKELEQWPQVKKNLNLLTGDCRFTSLHSSFDYAFENICGELYDLGIRKGLVPLNKKIFPYLRCLSEINAGKNPFGGFLASLISASVSLLGYNRYPQFLDHVGRRLDDLVAFSEKFDPASFYVPDPADMPRVWQGKGQMVNPDMYDPKKGIALPLIHDLNSWINITDSALKPKAEKMVAFILSSDYQEGIKPGFGIVKAAPHRYYAMGWSVHVPGWKRDFVPEDMAKLFRYLEVFAHFKAGRESPWFKRSLAWLDRFVDDDELCRIPKQALKVTSPSYWVTGGRIGLEPSPRTYDKRVLEATFRLLLVKKIMEAR